MAWYQGNSSPASGALPMTHPVGQKKMNELGLYDMSGNMFEWCLDDWNSDSSKLTAEFTRGNETVKTRRAVRGGFWHGLPKYCRTASRQSATPTTNGYYYGFRIVLVPESY